MNVRTKSAAIFVNNQRMFALVRAAGALLAFAAAAWQLASSPLSFHDFDRESAAGVLQSKAIPAGYILPAKLEHTFSVMNVRPGDAITARIMQEVPLPNRGKLAFRSVVTGTVLNVTRDADESGAEVTLRFDRVTDHGENLPIVTSLRAMASHMEVDEAQMPRAVYDEQTPLTWATTYQIGGDQRFGDGGAVRNRRKEKVGKAVRGGVLVEAKANTDRGCEGPVDGDNHPQALWLFSADACGVYGMKSVQLLHSGQGSPAGEITLHFKKASMKLSAGTGLLLRVIAAP